MIGDSNVTSNKITHSTFKLGGISGTEMADGNKGLAEVALLRPQCIF